MRPTRPANPPPNGALQALDILWQPRALLGVLLAGEGLALVLALAPGRGDGRWIYFALASLLIQWVSLLSLGTLYVLRRRLARMRPQQVAWSALGVLVAHALVVSAWAWEIAGVPSGGTLPDAIAFGVRGAVLALAVGLVGLVAFRNHWAARQAAVRLKQAELESLQARIRPHFLFNTLNTAAALVHSRPDTAEQVLLDLSDLFRAALAGPRDVTLAAELALTRRYLEIESLRFGDRLRVRWDLPADIPAVVVPALSIQPLVENAVKHSVERVERGCQIEIALTTTREHVLVSIRNPLVLGHSAHRSHHVGLSATQARVEALTDGRGRVETSVQGEHYVATVRLPRPTAPMPDRARWR